MKITTSTTLCFILLHQISAASINPKKAETLPALLEEKPNKDDSTNKSQFAAHINLEKTENIPSNSNQTLPNKAALNLIRKAVSELRSKPAFKHSNKQIMHGRLPGFLERIVQRIQNYFSVYNPPEYFENNRPPVTSNDGISIICANGENDSLSCNTAAASEPEEDCEQSTTNNEVSLNSAQQPTEEVGYNVVVTHTVVQDNLINVYSPNDPGVNGQFISNVVVILEPSADEFSPPIESTTLKNKFYVYVNPTKANANKYDLQTKLGVDAIEKPEEFQPYTNSTYTVFIRGDKLEEYSNNISNIDNSSLNPDISLFVQNSTDVKIDDRECNPSVRGDCESKITPVSDAENFISNVRTTPNVPNINLVLAPPDQRANKSCNKNKYDTIDPNVEYFILKPDDGTLSKKPKSNGTATNFYFLSKTKLDSISPTYLPPDELDSDQAEEPSATTSYVMPVNVNHTSTNKPPFLLSLFRRKQGEPR